MISGSFKNNVTYKLFDHSLYIYNLTLNKLLWLICPKTQTTNEPEPQQLITQSSSLRMPWLQRSNTHPQSVSRL